MPNGRGTQTRTARQEARKQRRKGPTQPTGQARLQPMTAWRQAGNYARTQEGRTSRP